jgi:hypothetical protein
LRGTVEEDQLSRDREVECIRSYLVSRERLEEGSRGYDRGRVLTCHCATVKEAGAIFVGSGRSMSRRKEGAERVFGSEAA